MSRSVTGLLSTCRKVYLVVLWLVQVSLLLDQGIRVEGSIPAYVLNIAPISTHPILATIIMKLAI